MTTAILEMILRTATSNALRLLVFVVRFCRCISSIMIQALLAFVLACMIWSIEVFVNLACM